MATNPNALVTVGTLEYFKQQLDPTINNKVDKETGKGLSTNDYTTAEKDKLAGIEAGANNYVHPLLTAQASGFYKVTVNATGHISAVERVSKADITNLGIPGENTTYENATETDDGLMSAADKEKLDNLPADANNYVHPAYTAQASGMYKITVDATGHVSSVTAVTKNDILSLGISEEGTTYDPATQTTDGLMSAQDKTKLDAFGPAANYALKADLTTVMTYKGSVATTAALPASGNITGDVYNVEADGMNYAWNGTAWDPLGSTLTLDYATNADIDAMFT